MNRKSDYLDFFYLMNEMCNDINTKVFFIRDREVLDYTGLYDGEFIFINSEVLQDDISALVSTFFLIQSTA